MSFVTLEQQMFQALYGDPTVNGLVGASIFASLLPRNQAGDAILYGRVSTARTVSTGSYTLDRGYTGLFRARMQIDCESADYNQTLVIANAAKLVIARMDLTGGGNSKANWVGDERDLNMPNQIAQFRRSFDALIWCVEEGRDG